MNEVNEIDEKIDISMGLTKEQIDLRINKGLINGDIDQPTKSVREILVKNIFTLFNLVNLILAVLVISVGAFKNALFIVLILCNTFIGLFQELRSKRTIDKLSLLSAPKATVLREGEQRTIELKDLLLDDIMIFKSGNQICADGILKEGTLEVNESLLTGEQDAILKKIGDRVLSGSFVVSGEGKVQVEKIGKDNYVAKITAGAKYIKKINSEIMTSLNSIIKLMSIIIFPLGIALVVKNFLTLELPFKDILVMTVAQIIGMIPEGLVLLTTVVFATGVVRLAKRKTLVQDLYCIETLARVNILCLDKTGTITTGGMKVEGVKAISGSEEEIKLIMGDLAFALNDENPTFLAIKEGFTNKLEWKVKNTIPFSSARKYSGVTFKNHGTYLLGAGEFILRERYKDIAEKVNFYGEQGKRVLTLVRGNEDYDEEFLNKDLEVLGLIILSDTIRAEAPETLKYFAEQGVDIRIISGDNPLTVSKIAIRAGLADGDKFIDATSLKTSNDVAKALENYKVFGRVTPDQKLEFVKYFKAQQNIVAMTGDGVNDVLALKEADCSVAMASGSDAARSVSSMVLLDNNFSSMPKIVEEGRRSINNLQRSSSLFLIKTIYATIFAILFIFLPFKYPYAPIQLTLIGAVLSGVPSLILALEPNNDILKGKFLSNAINTALPGAIYIVLSTVLMLVLSNPKFNIVPLSFKEQTTIATILLGVIMWFVLLLNSIPFSKLRISLVVTTAVIFAAINLCPYINVPICNFIAEFFDLVKLSPNAWYIAIPLTVLALPAILSIKKLLRKINVTDAILQKVYKFTDKMENIKVLNKK